MAKKHRVMRKVAGTNDGFATFEYDDKPGVFFIPHPQVGVIGPFSIEDKGFVKVEKPLPNVKRSSCYTLTPDMLRDHALEIIYVTPCRDKAEIIKLYLQTLTEIKFDLVFFKKEDWKAFSQIDPEGDYALVYQRTTKYSRRRIELIAETAQKQALADALREIQPDHPLLTIYELRPEIRLNNGHLLCPHKSPQDILQLLEKGSLHS